MIPNQQIGKMIILAGIVVILVGLGFYFSNRLPFLGKLPGDIAIKRENFQFYFPLGTSILLSIIITLILYLVRRFS
jgi:thiosulfate reductase cytochrome b subunit